MGSKNFVPHQDFKNVLPKSDSIEDSRHGSDILYIDRKYPDGMICFRYKLDKDLSGTSKMKIESQPNYP